MPVAIVLGVTAIVGAVAQSRSARRARQQQEAAIREGRGIQREATDLAEDRTGALFDEARRGTQQGFQQAIGIFGQAAPQQSSLFQQGNVEAQRQLLAGLPQQQNAILGGQVDFSALQPTQLQAPDFSFLQNLRLPDPISAQELIAQSREIRADLPPAPQQARGLRGFKEELDTLSIGRSLGIPSLGGKLLGGLF